MKINFEYDMEDGNFIEMIVNEVVSRIWNEVKVKVSEKISKHLTEKIDESIADLFNNYLDSKIYNPVNEWGAKKYKEDKTVKELIHEKIDKFLEDKVDCYGKNSKYGDKDRFSYYVEKTTETVIKNNVNSLNNCIDKSVKNRINELIKDKFADSITKNLNLEQLIK